jgi:hypothetical protein
MQTGWEARACKLLILQDGIVQGTPTPGILRKECVFA